MFKKKFTSQHTIGYQSFWSIKEDDQAPEIIYLAWLWHCQSKPAINSKFILTESRNSKDDVTDNA